MRREGPGGGSPIASEVLLEKSEGSFILFLETGFQDDHCQMTMEFVEVLQKIFKLTINNNHSFPFNPILFFALLLFLVSSSTSVLSNLSKITQFCVHIVCNPYLLRIYILVDFFPKLLDHTLLILILGMPVENIILIMGKQLCNKYFNKFLFWKINSLTDNVSSRHWTSSGLRIT